MEVRWSSRSIRHSLPGSLVWRAWMITESRSFFDCSAAILRWSQILSVGMVEVEWYAENGMQRTHPRCVCDDRFLVVSESRELVVDHRSRPDTEIGHRCEGRIPLPGILFPLVYDRPVFWCFVVHGFCSACQPKRLILLRRIPGWICSRRFLLANVVSWDCWISAGLSRFGLDVDAVCLV